MRPEWPGEWRQAADQSDYHLTLTAEHLAALTAELHAVLARHSDAQDTSLPTAQRVTVLLQAFPSPERRS